MIELGKKENMINEQKMLNSDYIKNVESFLGLIENKQRLDTYL